MSDVSLARQALNFPNAVEEHFAFLAPLGFVVVERNATLVRFRRDDVVAEVYHGRSSFEIGFHIGRGDQSYSLGTIVAVSDPEAGARYRDYATRTHDGVIEGVANLAKLVQRYAMSALQGDAAFYEALDERRRMASADLALDSLVFQIRPKADEAFRARDYARAAELYERILPRLSPAELQKLKISRERAR